MSADVVSSSPIPQRTVRVQSEPVTVGRVVRAEWIKYRSLRSSWAMLGGAAIGMVLIAIIVAYNTRHLSTNLQLDDIAPSATLQGYYLAQLLVGALGALIVSGEYGTGMIRSSLAAVPRRLPVIWAKLVVFASTTIVTMTIVSIVAFTAAQALISRSRTGFSLTDPGVARVVIGTAIYLTMLGVLASAIGWIVHSTPGAIVAYVGLILVVPNIFDGLLGSWGRQIAQYFPSRAGASFSTSISQSTPNLSPTAGAIVLMIWVIAGIALSARVLATRDA